MVAIVVPDIDESECNGCGDCVVACHTDAVELVDGKAYIARPEDCDYCADCETICPSGAIICFFEIALDEKGAN